jgi:hypothetical protein
MEGRGSQGNSLEGHKIKYKINLRDMYSVGYIMEFLMLQDSGMTWILYLRSTSH